jgi:hypothetical protein
VSMETAALDLWFIRPRRTPWFGAAALLVSGASLAYVLDQYFLAQESLLVQQVQAAELQKRSRVSHAPAERSDPSAESLQTLSAAQRALRYDWNAVFAEIERGVSQPLRLESLSHERLSGRSLITVERLGAEIGISASANGLPVDWRVIEQITTEREGLKSVKIRAMVDSKP